MKSPNVTPAHGMSRSALGPKDYEGDYHCVCHSCKSPFSGQKYHHVCRECHGDIIMSAVLDVPINIVQPDECIDCTNHKQYIALLRDALLKADDLLADIYVGARDISNERWGEAFTRHSELGCSSEENGVVHEVSMEDFTGVTTE